MIKHNEQSATKLRINSERIDKDLLSHHSVDSSIKSNFII
ncbi:hypothetical protein EZS27_029590 [termite gut metagenome]|uniref:Uncharacterized protein n=1 Tax=termite gut metagenome TaxID=433724 RepID=A0A5J4QI84_9ZZZZ